MRTLPYAISLLIVSLAMPVLHAQTLIGTYTINALQNAGGCPPVNPSLGATPSDGNPYSCVGPYAGPIVVAAPPGNYRVVVTGITDPGTTNGRIWAGNATGGTGYYINPQTIGTAIDFTLTFGNIILYTYDWYAYDNDPSGTITVNLYSIVGGALSITTPSPLPAGGDAVSYPTQTFAASNGTPPYTWSISAGSLPSGLTLSSGGVLSGVVGLFDAIATYSFTVQVTDSTSPNQTATKPFTLTIDSFPSFVTPSPLPMGFVGVPYSLTFQASGALPPYTWKLGTFAGNALPPGLSLSSVGVLTGTPTTAGPFSFGIGIVASDGQPASKMYSLTIAVPLTLNCSPATGPTTVGTFYTAACTATGGTSPYNWSISTGALPAGLTLTPSATSATISGTPTSPGPYSYTLQVTDSSTPPQGATHGYSGAITTTQPTVSSISPASGTVGSSVPVGITGSGFVASQFISGQTMVSISGTGAPVTLNVTNINVSSSTSLNGVLNIPANAPTGSYCCLAAFAPGFSYYSGVSFVVNGPPTIASISPASGTAGSSVPVTILGTGFVAGQTAVSATGAGVNVSDVNVTTNTSLTATLNIVSTASPGSIAIYVTVYGGVQSNSTGFLIKPPVATPYSVLDHGSISLISSGSGSTAVTGYATVVPTSSIAPAGVAIFGYREGNVSISEAGVPVSSSIQNGRIYAEVTASTDTGLAIANPGNQDAFLNFYFTNTSGQNFALGTATVPAHQQIARFLDQAPFNGGSSIQGTFTFSSSVPVSAIALRTLINARGDFLMTTLPTVDLSQPAVSSAEVLPHFADGAGWISSVILINPGDNAISGTVVFRDSTGAGVTTTIGNQTNSNFSYNIAARSSFKLVTAGNGATTAHTGSIQIVPANSTPSPTPLIVFSFTSGGVTVSEAGVPQTSATAFRTYVEQSGAPGDLDSIQTGLAVANTSSVAETINYEVFNPDGSSAASSASISLPVSGQASKLLTELFPTLPVPFRGLVRISTSGSGLSVTTLRIHLNQRGEYLTTTIPAISEGASTTTAGLVFPQLVDGAGWTTQMALFAGQGASAGNITVAGQSGNNMNIGLQAGPPLVALGPSISISPTAAAVSLGATRQFQATLVGFTNQSVTWKVNGVAGGNSTVGTISSSGVYTAPLILPATPIAVTVASNADSTKSASASVTFNPVTIVIAPPSATVKTGDIQQFTATVTGTSNTAVTWSVNGILNGNSSIGTISSTGLYTAPAVVPSPAQVVITVTSSADPTKSASASVTISSGIGISVSPTSVNVPVGGSQQFTAIVTNTSNTAVTWAVDPIPGVSVGTISSDGIYTAPIAIPPQSASLKVSISATSAADPTIRASASVTVIVVIEGGPGGH
jgi:hypothetical protein